MNDKAETAVQALPPKKLPKPVLRNSVGIRILGQRRSSGRPKYRSKHGSKFG